MPRPVFKSVVFILLLALTGTGCLSALSEKTVGFPFTRKTPVADEADTAEAVEFLIHYQPWYRFCSWYLGGP